MYGPTILVSLALLIVGVISYGAYRTFRR